MRPSEIIRVVFLTSSLQFRALLIHKPLCQTVKCLTAHNSKPKLKVYLLNYYFNGIQAAV